VIRPVTTNRPASTRRNFILAALFLAAVLAAGFAPALLGRGTLMHASWDAASVLNTGAYDTAPKPILRLQRTLDPGAAAWQSEAWSKLISREFWNEFTLPLWNPYNGYGTPLSADAQSQPFYPLTTLLSLHVTSWTYNFYYVARLFLGGVLMYLFAAQFLSALPSVFAAVTFMLTGYFIVYLNITHLSVEVLTPGIFLTFELLARRNSWAAVAGVAFMLLIANTGGMPESLFLILAFACLYFVCRVLFTPEFRSRGSALAVKSVIAILLGFALAGFVLLPLSEFLRIAHDVHQTSNTGGIQGGLGADRDYRLMLLYLLPLSLGPVLNSILSATPAYSGIRGYWGIIPFFFSTLAVLMLLSRKRAGGWSAERFLTIFFAATLALMILKRFGNVLVNWIGGLPLFEMVVFPKYQEPLIALCIAMLGGIGFAALVQRRTTRLRLIAAAIVTLAVMLGLAATWLPAVQTLAVKTTTFRSLTLKVSLFYYLSILCGVVLLLVLLVLVAYAQLASEHMRRHLVRATVVMLSFELLSSFIIPSFYVLGSLAPLRADPYKGAPYIDFIRAENADHFRVFGRGQMLYPNWSSAFQLADVRNIDALNFDRYRTFVRSFLLPPETAPRLNGELADRLTGDEFPYEFDTDQERRFLAISSIKYLITDTEFGWPPTLQTDILDQHKGETLWGIAPQVFRIGDKTTSSVRGLFQHPGAQRLSYSTVIDANAPMLEGLAVMKKEAFADSDGVGFRLELRDGERTETLFEAMLDPRNVPADRNGRPIRVDLSRYAGREVELVFSTNPGPAADVFADWPGWARLRFAARETAAPAVQFKKIYQQEALVYEVPKVLPRAALYSAVEILPDSDVLDRLKEPTFDPERRAIVSRESLAPEQIGPVQSLAGSAALQAASIVQYKSQRVRIEAESAAPALLVLNDSNFPGWRAYVNGEAAAIVNANYLFRGVLVPAGKSVVEFRYEPRSFQAGLALSLAAFVIIALLALRERGRRGASLHQPE
jgi:hypothetical protein